MRNRVPRVEARAVPRGEVAQRAARIGVQRDQDVAGQVRQRVAGRAAQEHHARALLRSLDRGNIFKFELFALCVRYGRWLKRDEKLRARKPSRKGKRA